MGAASAVTVFLSHSHADRDAALTLQAALKKNSARVFLDQEQIFAGDNLPTRISSGIASCDVLLVLWSRNSAKSQWVQREIEVAKALSKKIVPYRLDSTPLSLPLRDLVCIDISDQQHAHSELLTAVFTVFEPEPTDLFPGRWRAEVTVEGLVGGDYDLELKRNGQLTGTGHLKLGGFLPRIMEIEGLETLLSTNIPIRGNWTYDDRMDLLTMTWTTQGFGQSHTERISLRATGREQGAIQGQDLGGRLWTLQRVKGNAGPVMAAGSGGSPSSASKGDRRDGFLFGERIGRAAYILSNARRADVPLPQNQRTLVDADLDSAKALARALRMPFDVSELNLEDVISADQSVGIQQIRHYLADAYDEQVLRSFELAVAVQMFFWEAGTQPEERLKSRANKVNTLTEALGLSAGLSGVSRWPRKGDELDRVFLQKLALTLNMVCKQQLGIK
jgi:hypothetical protein